MFFQVMWKWLWQEIFLLISGLHSFYQIWKRGQLEITKFSMHCGMCTNAFERQVISSRQNHLYMCAMPYTPIQWVGMILSKNPIWLLDKYILYDISRTLKRFSKSFDHSPLSKVNASWATFKLEGYPFYFIYHFYAATYLAQ